MDEYYKVLGLTPDASEAEIKKAYFKLIRKYSPESDPEKFQEIRQAYEQLKGGNAEKTGPDFPPFSEPFAEKMYKQMEYYYKADNMKLFRDTCEEAWRLFPDDVVFLYHLVVAYRRCGNTGKAVKSAEQLVKLDQNNMWYQRELANSCMDRGFTKKAFVAFQKAYELGFRKIDFLISYMSCCMYCGEYECGSGIVMETLFLDKKWIKENVPEMIEIILYFLEFQGWCNSEEEYVKGFDRVLELLNRYKMYIGDYVIPLAYAMNEIIRPDNTSAIYDKTVRFLDILDEACLSQNDRDIIEDIRYDRNMFNLNNDTRLSDTLQRGVEAFCYDDYEPILLKYARLDVQLCMIEEREEVLSQIDMIREEYPDYYDKIRDFVEKLKNEKDLPQLKQRLKKEYDRLCLKVGGGYYYELYPLEKMVVVPKVIVDAYSEMPYVRSEKKIGRNDPCPCGSGKKYKQCCMKKQEK